MDLEKQLRDALRAVDPDAAFAQRVAAAIANPRSAASPAPAARRWAMPAALAASLLVTVAVALHFQAQRESRRAYEAHAQLMHALEITSSRLDDIHRNIEQQFEENVL